MLLLGFLICLLCLIFSLYKERILIAPTIIMTLLWMLSYFLQFLRSDLNHQDSNYLIFAFGVCFFYVGYYTIQSLFFGKKSIELENISYTIKNKKIYDSFFYIVLFLFMIYLLSLAKLVVTNFNFNIWQSIVIAKNNEIYKEPFIVEYGRLFTLAFTLFSFLIWFSNRKDISIMKLSLLTIISFVFSFTSGNRGTMFLFFIAVVFLYIIQSKMKNKRIIILLSILLSIILIIFIATTFSKFVFEDQSDTSNFLMSKFRLYFTTSMPAFVEWLKNSNDNLNGLNTFNFFVKIFEKLGYQVESISSVQPFTYVGVDKTNVYTIYQYYVQDFGLFFSLIMQMFLGAFHSFLFNKTYLSRKPKAVIVLLCSLFYFPLIYQFFAEQYFSLTSTWIQYFIWFSLFELMFIKKELE